MSKRFHLRPRKRLGQSFLHDQNIVRRIIALAELQSEDTVVEIGSGLGVMTTLIAARAKQVLALEIDPRLVEVLRHELGHAGNVAIVHTDVLAFDLSRAVKEHALKKIKVMGNIPYNISTPILFHLLEHRHVISSAILMVQKEVADRIAAGPGTKDYGIPSILTAVYACPFCAFAVPSRCFYPEPKVTSAVLRIDFRAEPLAFIEDEPFFKEVVRLSFSSRRKTLFNNLRRYDRHGLSDKGLQDLLHAEGLDIRIRGEALRPEQFISLSNALSHSMASQRPGFPASK
jgi:16S rRNA (adenine1518-N6/adenine1519-N6)-dimethyltransferase